MSNIYKDKIYEFNTLLLTLENIEENFQDCLSESKLVFINDIKDIIFKMETVIKKGIEVCDLFQEILISKKEDLIKTGVSLFPSHPIHLTLSDLTTYKTEYDDLFEHNDRRLYFEIMGMETEINSRQKRINGFKTKLALYHTYDMYETYTESNFYEYSIDWKCLFTEIVFYIKLTQNYLKTIDNLIKMNSNL